jgi:hypothetical protein
MRRFWSKIEPDMNSGCWLWNGSASKNGYGFISVRDGKNGKDYTVLAHRFAYSRLKRIPNPGLVLDHKCRTPLCVNPDHLDEVSQMENILRSPLAHQHKTHCPKGHEYTPENIKPVVVNGYNGRSCRACHNDRERARRRSRSKTGG